MRGRREHGVAAPGIVVPRHHVHLDAERRHALVGQCDPATQLVQHDLLEETRARLLVALVARDLGGVCDPGVHAVVAHGVGQLIELDLRAPAAGLPQEARAERTAGSALDGHDRLAREVAAHDQRVHFVEAPGAEELAPALVGAMHVGGVVQLQRLRGAVPILRALAETGEHHHSYLL